MEFDIINVNEFIKEAKYLENQIEENFAYDDSLYSLDKISSDFSTWANNLATVENLESLLEDGLNNQELVLISFQNRLDGSSLSLLKYFKDIIKRRKKATASTKSVVPFKSHEPNPLNENEVASDNAIIQFEVHPKSKFSGVCASFDVISCYNFRNLIHRLPCTYIKHSMLFEEVSRFCFECPGSISVLRNLSASLLESTVQQRSWYLIEMEEKYFGEAIPQFLLEKTGPICSLNISDSNIRLYQPFELLHNGLCEHIVLIKQLRLASNFDLVRFGNEAFCETHRSKERKYTCRLCEQFVAIYLTVDDRLAPENPCFFCSRCFESLHYDENGVLVYPDFKFFPLSGDFYFQ